MLDRRKEEVDVGEEDRGSTEVACIGILREVSMADVSTALYSLTTHLERGNWPLRFCALSTGL